MVTVRILGHNEAAVLDNVAAGVFEPAKRMYRAAGAIPDEALSVMFTYRMRPDRDDA